MALTLWFSPFGVRYAVLLYNNGSPFCLYIRRTHVCLAHYVFEMYIREQVFV